MAASLIFNRLIISVLVFEGEEAAFEADGEGEEAVLEAEVEEGEAVEAAVAGGLARPVDFG